MAAFRPHIHIPHYAAIFFRCLFTPLLVFMLVAGNFVMFLCTLGFYYVEVDHNPLVQNIFDSLWWAFCTITTVGYGDITPVTLIGKAIAIVLMITGVTFFVSYTAVLASLVVSETLAERQPIPEQRLRHIENMLKKSQQDRDRIA